MRDNQEKKIISKLNENQKKLFADVFGVVGNFSL